MSVISAPVNDRPVDFHAHDLEVFRLIFPPRLIGSPFVVYDGANCALKGSRSLRRPIAPARALVATGLPDGLCARRLDDAVIGRTMGRDSGWGKGCTEGRGPTIASTIRRPAAGSTGEKRSYPYLANPLHVVAHLASSRT